MWDPSHVGSITCGIHKAVRMCLPWAVIVGKLRNAWVAWCMCGAYCTSQFLHEAFLAVVSCLWCYSYALVNMHVSPCRQVWHFDGTCFIGFDDFQSAFLFSLETQQTIGGFLRDW